MLKIYAQTQTKELLAILEKRNDRISGEILQTVSQIVQDVRTKGDVAVRAYTKQFDKLDVGEFLLPQKEYDRLAKLADPALQETIKKAAENIYAYHSKQKQQSRIDIEQTKAGIMGQRVMPLKRVGLYVPGGTAAYPSSVLMNAVPAKVAGVEEIIIATPPQGEDAILPAVAFAAKVAGVEKIYTIGGAQAVAAMAYGTESVPRVDKIVGPGNVYVTAAKKLVFGTVDIDMMAGPSEILVIADEAANPKYVAADMLSQAEHDINSAAILITTDASLPKKVSDEIDAQLKRLSRPEIAGASIKNYGCAIVVSDLAAAASLSDSIAPEHLELAVKEPFALLKQVRNAGSVFLGNYSSEPLGDYFAGPNHVLPTNGTARFASPLSVDDFIKKSSFLFYDKAELLQAGEDVMRFAKAEGLDAHANAIAVRMQDE